VAALASCATAKKTPEQASEPFDFGLPPVRAALAFPAGASEVTLAWLVDELARLTGQELTMHPEVQKELDASLEPLELTTPVPADEVYAYVEGMLAMQGMLIAPVKGGERPVLGVYGPTWRLSGPVEMQPVVIDSEEFEALAGHPALFCQVMLVFENIDSRQLQTQLRQLLVNAHGSDQCVPAGDRALLLQASGAKLLGLVRLLREVDLASAARPRAAPAQPASTPSQPGAPRPAGGG
jgi:hypothetical protein